MIRLNKKFRFLLPIFCKKYTSNLKSFVSNPNTTAIRRIDSSNNLVWMTALSFKPLLMSLATDPSEQNIYILTSLGVNDVIRLQSTNGAIVSAQSL